MPNRTNGVKDYTWGAKRSRKTLFIIIGAVVVVGAVAASLIIFGGKSPTPSGNTSTPTSNTKAQQARKIDGVTVNADEANIFPVAVMIENLVSARPQSGLRDANVVYEALAEGGITRFLAVYASGTVIPKIGPVRSARSYYLDFALEYGALYAHIGGSPQALADIKTLKVFDLNQFYNSAYFWRAEDRPRPHNLYTSSEKLVFARRDLKAPAQGSFDPWTFKKEAALSERPTVAKTIDIDFSSFSYRVQYTYNRDTNTYLRGQGGESHLDANGKQIEAKNVIIQYVKTSLADADGRLSMTTVGDGKAIIFRDGAAVEGTWKKENRSSRTTFVDAKGDDIELNPGTTWVEIVPADRTITYTK